MTNNEKIEQVVEINVPSGQTPGVRLDVYLTEKLQNATRSKVQKGIRESRVWVNGDVVTKPSHGIQPEDRIRCTILRSPPIEVVPEDISLDVVYEDDWLLVVNKPAGMVVHPAYGHRSGTLVNALLHHVGSSTVSAEDLEDDEIEDDDVGLSTINAAPRFEGDVTVRPGLVHRLDKDTSGLLVVAKKDEAHSVIAKQFAERSIRRRYLGLVWGRPDPEENTIETNLGRDPRDRRRVAVLQDGSGKHAVTHFKTIETFAHTALVRFRLETGRTHQIRIHAKHLGHPLFGDTTYGGARIVYGSAVGSRAKFIGNLLDALGPRQALHAHTLGFTHPGTGEAIDFKAPLPEDMARVIERLRRVEPDTRDS